MIDPWITSRQRLYEEQALLGNLSVDGIRTKNLLSDADTLLPLLNYAQHRIGCPAYINLCDCGLDKLLADLPAHLKG